ncbi:MAG: hypothetical protein KGS09_18735 [Nitrospirae bacterium]|nr:hypothetical protein [Nitrospirota bacterium]
MTPLTYVIGAVLLSVIVVAILYFSPDRSVRCPRCGAVMPRGGEGAWDPLIRIRVVPESGSSCARNAAMPGNLGLRVEFEGAGVFSLRESQASTAAYCFSVSHAVSRIARI